MRAVPPPGHRERTSNEIAKAASGAVVLPFDTTHAEVCVCGDSIFILEKSTNEQGLARIQSIRGNSPVDILLRRSNGGYRLWIGRNSRAQLDVVGLTRWRSGRFCFSQRERQSESS